MEKSVPSTTDSAPVAEPGAVWNALDREAAIAVCAQLRRPIVRELEVTLVTVPVVVVSLIADYVIGLKSSTNRNAIVITCGSTKSRVRLIPPKSSADYEYAYASCIARTPDGRRANAAAGQPKTIEPSMGYVLGEHPGRGRPERYSPLDASGLYSVRDEKLYGTGLIGAPTGPGAGPYRSRFRVACALSHPLDDVRRLYSHALGTAFDRYDTPYRQAQARRKGIVHSSGWISPPVAYESISDPISYPPVICSESIFTAPAQRNELAAVWFDEFDVPALSLVPKPVLSLFGSGRTSGMVLQIGGASSTACGILDGRPLRVGLAGWRFGGRDCIEAMRGLLAAARGGSHGTTGYEFSSNAEEEIVQHLFETKAYVAPAEAASSALPSVCDVLSAVPIVPSIGQFFAPQPNQIPPYLSALEVRSAPITSHVDARLWSPPQQSSVSVDVVDNTRTLQFGCLPRVSTEVLYRRMDEWEAKYCPALTSQQRAELERLEPNRTHASTYELPDGQVIGVGYELASCAELLFNPDVWPDTVTVAEAARTKLASSGMRVPDSHFYGAPFTARPSNPGSGVHHLVLNALQFQSDETRRLLGKNVVAAGGTARLPGFASRLQHELKSRTGFPDAQVVCCEARGKPILAFTGAGVIASLSNFVSNYCVSRAEWAECGSVYRQPPPFQFIDKP